MLYKIFRQIANSVDSALVSTDPNSMNEAKRLLQSLSDDQRYNFHFEYPETFDAIESGIRKEFIDAIKDELKEMKKITEADIKSIEEDVREYESS
jgi:hypothetical protein